MICAVCDLEAPSEARFCPGCGTSLVARCRACSAPNPAVARICVQCGLTLDDGVEVAEQRGLKVVTIVVVRLESPERLGGLDPEDAARTLERFYREAGDCVCQLGGTFERIAGATVWFRFGAPITRADDALRAAIAARRIAADRYPVAGAGDMGAIVGLATGVAIAGHDDHQGGAHYALLGDVLDTATKLCDLAGAGEVLSDEDTVAHLREFMGFSSVERSGVACQKLEIRATTIDVAWRALGPLFGRESETRRLDGAALAALDGCPQVIAISGEQGSGKSRLALEAWRAVSSRESAGLVVARAQSHQAETPHQVIAALLENWVRVDPTDPASTLDRLAALALHHDRPDPETVAKRLATFLGIRSSGSDLLETTSMGELSDLVLAAARKKPLVLVFDDLQWADDRSRIWLERLLAAAETVTIRLIVVLSGTSPAAVGVSSALETTTLRLRPLAENASWSLIAGRLGESAPPNEWPADLQAIASEVVRKAGGNPFILTELLRSMTLSGRLTRGSSGWIASQGLEGLDLPPSLKGLVSAKLERLSAQERVVLGIAAAFGSQVEAIGVTSVAGFDAGSCLRALSRAGLLSPRDEEGLRFGFNQEVYRIAAYQAMLPSERATVHKGIAAYIHESAPDFQEQIAGTIANHLALANEDLEALGFAYQAGVAASARRALWEALRQYRLCLELHAASPEAEAAVPLDSILEDLVGVELELGIYEVAIVRCNQLVARLSGKRKVAIQKTLGTLFEKRGRLDEAMQVLRDGVALARQLGLQAEVAGLLCSMATIELRRGNFIELTFLLDEAVKILDDAPDDTVEAYAHSLLGIAYYHLAEHDKAMGHHRRALVLREGLRDVPGMIRSLSNLGNVHADWGRFEQAEDLYERALRIAREGNMAPEIGTVLNNLGHLALLRGDHAEAETSFRECETISRRIRDERATGLSLVNLGLLRSEQGREDDAWTYLREGYGILDALGLFEQHVQILIAMARLAFRQKKPVVAWQHLQRALFHANEEGQTHLQALAMRSIGEHLTEQGMLGEAIAILNQALQTEARRSPFETARTYRSLARALDAAGRMIESVGALRQAASLVQGLDLPADLRDLAGVVTP